MMRSVLKRSLATLSPSFLRENPALHPRYSIFSTPTKEEHITWATERGNYLLGDILRALPNLNSEGPIALHPKWMGEMSSSVYNVVHCCQEYPEELGEFGKTLQLQFNCLSDLWNSMANGKTWSEQLEEIVEKEMEEKYPFRSQAV